jgi:hypothetical protein
LTYQDSLNAKLPGISAAVTAATNLITPLEMRDLAKSLADVYAPTGSVSLALSDIVKVYLDQVANRGGGHLIQFHHNFLSTGNIAIEVGNPDVVYPPIITAHGDEISYWASPAPGVSEVQLYPLHTDRLGADETMPGVALRYDDLAPLHGAVLRQVAQGQIQKKRAGARAVFIPDPHSDPIRVGDRIVFDPRPRLGLAHDGDTLAGIIDNRAGVAILLAALPVLVHLAQTEPELAALLVITDGEEGIAEPPVFSTGAQYLGEALNEIPRYRMSKVVNVDGHDYLHSQPYDQLPIREQPLLAGIISRGKGLAMPLETVAHVYALIEAIHIAGGPKAVFDDAVLTPDGVSLVGASRSDEEGLRRAGKAYFDIYALGYGVRRPHHQGGIAAEASLRNLVATTQWLLPLLVAGSFGLL